MWIDLFEWAKNVKVFVFCVNVHQRVTSAEKHLNSQVDRMICSVDISQLLPPAAPLIAQWPHEQSGHGGGDGSNR